MKILYINDLHIQPNKFNINNSSDYGEIIHIFKDINDIVLNKDIKLVVFNGDLFHTSNVISAPVLSFVSSLFNTLSKLCEIVILSGNHDIYETDDRQVLEDNIKFSLLTSFKYMNNLRVIDNNIEKLKLSDDNYTTNTVLYFVPYNNKPKSIISKYMENNAIRHDINNIMFGHFDVFEIAKINHILSNNMENFNEDDYPNHEYLDDLFDVSILGHIHNNIRFGNVIYDGSIRNTNFNDTDIEKYFSIIDTDKLTFEHIPINYNNIFITLNNLEDLNNYINKYNTDYLIRTNLKYRYSTNEEALQMPKFKKYFKSLTLEKNIINNETENKENIKNTLKELQKTLRYDMITESNIIDFIIENAKLDDKKEYKKILNYILKVN